jgi:type VI secretion system secreted protein VgrG
MSEERAVRLTTALGDKLRFRRMTGEEGLGRPFQFEIELGSDDAAIDLADLLGTAVAVDIGILGGGKRHFHGLVARAGFVGFGSDEARYRVSVRPWLWFLTRTADCRIFQDKTTPDIIHAIFDKYTDSSVHVEDRLQGSYTSRNYCVQYRETDLDFVDRLLQDEGATYFFVHDADKHTLVLADAPEAYHACPDYEKVPYFPLSAQARRERDHVNGWDAQAEVRTGSFAHTSFDFERSRTDLLTRRDLPLTQAGWAEGEVYDYAGNYTVRDLGQQTADRRLEADQAEHRLAFGEGTAAGLAAGFRFTLARYPRDDQNIEYLVREVAHEVVDPAYRSGEEGGQEVEVYRCRFTAMPADVPYRPALVTSRPLIRGPQTAIVTGPAGEEIWTDRFGRVKLQFHWDREGKRDERTSCWVRVSQLWAGTAFGGIHVPRIGQEVMVEFLEGDPDRPIVTGRVYNDQAMPPYGLPANATQSGIKSNSSKGGGGSNELRFEDKKGAEQVWLHAQKNEDIVVENDKTEKVGHDETIGIGNDRTETVGHDETMSVGNNRTRKVGANETVTVGANQTVTVQANRTDTVAIAENRTVGAAQQQTVGAARNVTVGASQSHEVGISDSWGVGVDRSVQIGKNDSLNVGSDRSADVGKNDSLHVGSDRSAKIDKGDTLSVGKNLAIDAGDQITITTGSASITMKKDGTITIAGKDITIDASGKINVKASGNITMKGQKILQN